MIEKIKSIFPKTRVSHPVSKLLRPIFETKRTGTAFGGLIALTSLLVGAGFYLPQQGQVQAWGEINQVLITTKRKVAPLPETTGISQGFHALHPGVDLQAPIGSLVYPIAEGVVSLVEHSNLGYGRYIEVKHGDKLSSLYAHIGKIMVEEGERVTVGTALGEVGLTGRTTGYHLHLEVRKKGVVINPRPYL